MRKVGNLPHQRATSSGNVVAVNFRAEGSHAKDRQLVILDGGWDGSRAEAIAMLSLMRRVEELRPHRARGGLLAWWLDKAEELIRRYVGFLNWRGRVT